MNIHRALSDVADIRAQLARTEEYRGFRSAAVGVSVLVLQIGCLIQQSCSISAVTSVGNYLAVWIPVAAISALVAGVEMIIRGRITRDAAVWRMHRQLAWQLAPALFVGAVLTLIITSGEQGPHRLTWSLPGIWSLVYGLGLLACSQRLPTATRWVAMYFLASGSLVLLAAFASQQADAWQMLVTFGVGQTALGLVLFWNLERDS